MYPLLFHPIICPKIWGQEIWIISAQGDKQTTVANGTFQGMPLQQLVDLQREALLGQHVYEHFGTHFPLLFKFIEANDDLSVQVHPNDEQAAEMEHSLGKNEMWYVLPESRSNAHVICGWKKDVTPDQVRDAAENGELLPLLCCHKVEPGNVVQVNAGTVHALLRGTRVAEIQENSDVTYRLFDYDRRDNKGLRRELHLDKALQVLDFSAYTDTLLKPEERINALGPMYRCSFYVTNKICINGTLLRDYAAIDSFVVYLCTEGELQVKDAADDNVVTLSRGQGLMIPASVAYSMLTPVTDFATILEIYIP